MKQFEEFAKCPKCCETASQITKTYNVDEGEEHLLCHCNCCGYEWKQETADAE